MSSLPSNPPKLGARSTRQRTAVVSVLSEIETFSSARQIYEQLDSRGMKVGLTTVYRTLQSLADLHMVDVLHMSNGETLYRQCSSDSHHHHLVCTSCGRTEEIDGGPVETWAKGIASEHGFSMSGHDAEIFGLCATCHPQED